MELQWERQRSNYDNGCKVIKRGKYDLLIQHMIEFWVKSSEQVKSLPSCNLYSAGAGGQTIKKPTDAMRAYKKGTWSEASAKIFLRG